MGRNGRSEFMMIDRLGGLLCVVIVRPSLMFHGSDILCVGAFSAGIADIRKGLRRPQSTPGLLRGALYNNNNNLKLLYCAKTLAK